MKKKNSLITVILVVLSLIAIGMTVEAVVLKEKYEPKQTLFDVEIQFYLYEGYGCACKPVQNASLLATSGEGYDQQYTDNEGFCSMTLVINTEYRITIEAEGFYNIIFDFYTVDDQYFIFHMEEEEDDSSELTDPLVYEKIYYNKNTGE